MSQSFRFTYIIIIYFILIYIIIIIILHIRNMLIEDRMQHGSVYEPCKRSSKQRRISIAIGIFLWCIKYSILFMLFDMYMLGYRTIYYTSMCYFKVLTLSNLLHSIASAYVHYFFLQNLSFPMTYFV